MSTTSGSVTSSDSGSVSGGAENSSSPLFKLDVSTWNLFFCFFLVLPSIVWIVVDKTVWAWDQSCYGLFSIGFFRYLTESPLDYLGAVTNAIYGSRAPGIALVGQFFVPLGLLFGKVDFFLLLSIVLESFVSLTLMLSIGQTTCRSNRLPAYLACLVLASFPLFINVTRTYLVESLQLLGIVYFYWILATFSRRTSDMTGAHLIFASVICLLAKVSTPLYCLIPGLVILVKLFLKGWKKVLPIGARAYFLWAIGLCSLVQVAIWYHHNLGAILAFTHQTSVGDIAEFYGQKAPIMVKMQAWLEILREQTVIEPVLFALPVVLGIPAYAIGKGMMHPPSPREACRLESKHLLGLVALAQIVVVVVVLVTSVAEDPRYAYGILPSVVVAFLVLSSYLSNGYYFGACLILFGGQFAVANLYSFGFEPDLLSKFTVMNVVKNESEQKTELKAVSLMTSDYAKRGYSTIVGISYHWLNGNTIAYENAKSRFDKTIWPKIEAWPMNAKQAEVSDWIKKRRKYIFITCESAMMNEQKEVPFANQLNTIVWRYVKTKGRRIDFPSDTGLIVYQVD